VDQRAKLTFWGTAAVAFLIVCVPTTYFVEALRRYERYLSGISPAALRPTRTRFVPHRDRPQTIEPKSRLDFVEFRLKQAQAKQVGLIGDFNGWKANGLPLARQPNGTWELLLPLPSGRHHYLFIVDGQPLLDPANSQTAEVSGRRASVKVIP
jgi:hypothetical protein